MADSAHPLPDRPEQSDEEIVRDVKAALRKMVIALARKAAYEDHLAAMEQRAES